ncbi:MAG: hypothetical protein J6T10_18590 [Methanobrevibacter sp.]|nr:hypothetical protein [Methanobrevibacter sp.]
MLIFICFLGILFPFIIVGITMLLENKIINKKLDTFLSILAVLSVVTFFAGIIGLIELDYKNSTKTIFVTSKDGIEYVFEDAHCEYTRDRIKIKTEDNEQIYFYDPIKVEEK